MEPKHCALCGAPFLPSNNRQAQRFCSDRCRYRHRDASRAGATQRCPWCWQDFTNRQRGQRATRVAYCSEQCAHLDKRTKSSPVPWVCCRQCQRWFVSRGIARKTCGAECAEKREQQAKYFRFTIHRGETTEGRCRDCGTAFSFVYVATPRRLCDACKEQRDLEYRRRHRSKHRDKARSLGVYYEPVDPRRVYARDGWRCGLCGRKVNPKLKYPHPLSASLDHVVPMNATDLGEHSYRNTQCSHLECNVAKGRMGSQQLRLLA